MNEATNERYLPGSDALGAGGGSRFIDVDGPVHLWDMGGPLGSPMLVCVHGLGGSHLNWTAIGPRLARTVRVVAIDLVGHGRTPMAARRADVEGHRRLLSGMLEALGEGPVTLIGNSMGGLVAALQAAVRPESVSGLVLIDPAIPVAPPGPVHPRVVANLLMCAVPGLGEGFLRLRRRYSSAEDTVWRTLTTCCVDPTRVAAGVVRAHVALTAELDRTGADTAYLQSARSLVRMLSTPTATIARLDPARLRQPTLVIQGAKDLLVPLSSARRLKATHPAWRLEVLDDTGHVPMLERPERTAELIEDWLGGDGSALPEEPHSSETDRSVRSPGSV